MKTLQELEAALKTCKQVYVWCTFGEEEGHYFQVTKQEARRFVFSYAHDDSINLRKPTKVKFTVELDRLYIA